jgi:hypothetical protein
MTETTEEDSDRDSTLQNSITPKASSMIETALEGKAYPHTEKLG